MSGTAHPELERELAGLTPVCGFTATHRDTEPCSWPAGHAGRHSWDQRKGSNVYWTREKIIAAIHAWELLYGAPPTYAEWKATDDPRNVTYPHSNTVVNRFGGWSDGLRAANDARAQRILEETQRTPSPAEVSVGVARALLHEADLEVQDQEAVQWEAEAINRRTPRMKRQARAKIAWEGYGDDLS